MNKIAGKIKNILMGFAIVLIAVGLSIILGVCLNWDHGVVDTFTSLGWLVVGILIGLIIAIEVNKKIEKEKK
jgi:predicted tellurium resistance membrane protein TerC